MNTFCGVGGCKKKCWSCEQVVLHRCLVELRVNHKQHLCLNRIRVFLKKKRHVYPLNLQVERWESHWRVCCWEEKKSSAGKQLLLRHPYQILFIFFSLLLQKYQALVFYSPFKQWVKSFQIGIIANTTSLNYIQKTPLILFFLIFFVVQPVIAAVPRASVAHLSGLFASGGFTSCAEDKSQNDIIQLLASLVSIFVHTQYFLPQRICTWRVCVNSFWLLPFSR